MNELTIPYEEKDLLVYFQQIRLLKARELNDNNINRTQDVKEEKTTLKGAFDNFGRFFERNVKNYNGLSENIVKAIEEFNRKNERVITKEEAEETINRLFERDNYGLAKLLFAASVILDKEYKYEYFDEGLEEASLVLYKNKGTLKEIKEQLEDNFKSVYSKPLSNLEAGTLIGLYAAWCASLIIFMPGLAALPIVITGIAMNKALEENKARIKEDFKSSSAEKNAFQLAVQLTYIQRIKGKLKEDEFKEELDSILKNVNELKSDLDYYLYVERESVENNVEKSKSFHKFDERLLKVLEIEK